MPCTVVTFIADKGFRWYNYISFVTIERGDILAGTIRCFLPIHQQIAAPRSIKLSQLIG
ncbi:MAG: hypothetical protein LUQ36_01895 [Methanoregula sp.]|nr:hypothetical protein [Methanoregula sp.]